MHSSRHTTGSRLAAAGVHPKVAQAVMRHSDINLTMSRYTHVFRGQETDAVAALPDLGVAPAKQSARATGTDGKPDDDDGPAKPPKNSARFLARQGSFSRTSTHQAAPGADSGQNAKTPENIGETQRFQGSSQIRPTGLEPVTCGLGNRRS
ncbi:MAG TPA: tyrosine-type recombinase/integrase, partial [Phycisphaerae bacterium]|nr:tyrosine-type recombinase/integrase [Phycisphaerae bacterium]